MSYYRIIPRDLFNEAKLLKCLGQISLMLNDYPGRWPLTLEHENPEEGFQIEQDDTSGSIYCRSLSLILRDEQQISLQSPLNSRATYPLQFGDQCENVFNEDGAFSEAFLKFIGA